MYVNGVRRPAITAVVLAAALAVLAAVVPPAAAPIAPLASFLAAVDAPVARAADDLAVTTKARYVVDPAKGVIRVVVDVSVLNQKPNRVAGGVITRYFYDRVNLGVQPEAAHLRATQSGARLPLTSASRKDFRLVTVQFGQNLYFGDTARFRLAFDLPAGEPRSSSDVRVGPAFATFLAWAFGDQGSVRIEVPDPFTVDISGQTMRKQDAGDTQVFTATTDNSLGWYAWVNARNDDGLTREGVDLADGEHVVVRGWPEDSRWRKRVASILSESVPDLVNRIGLPWPVDGSLNVLEVHTPLLEGYAGFYDPKSDEITISENLDDLTIVHEASHAWFNSRLFGDRWINEGLAEEYASRVLASEARGRVDPAPVKRSAKAAFPLLNWSPPAPIRDPQGDAREQYGYDAAWTVIRSILDETGEDGMRRVFQAADAGTTAYPGAGAPEHTALPNDWRRFLDLVEQVGGATDAADLLQTWVLPARDAAQLADRAAARSAYEALVADEDGWTAPPAVRLALDGWAFGEANARIDDALAILRQRDATDAEAAANQLDPPANLEQAYESADSPTDLAAAAELAANTQGSLAGVVTAATAAAAPRDWLTNLGLGGKDPDGDVAAARTAWEAGNLGEANERAAEASGTLAVAAEAGRGRAVVIGGGATIAILLLLVLVVVWLVRRRQGNRRRRALAAARSTPTGAAGPDAVMPAGEPFEWSAPFEPLDAGEPMEPPGPPPPPSP